MQGVSIAFGNGGGSTVGGHEHRSLDSPQLMWQEENRMTRIPMSQADEQARTLERNLDLSTAEIGLQVRTTNCLEERGIFTVRQLLHASPETLLSIANFGEKTLEEVYLALERIGYFRPWRKPR
jgi:DNA-directed RNA polymerase subunit alpha